jgi:hypothetical protein
MYMSDEDGDDFEEVCLPVNLEDDGYNMIHTHDDYAAFILAGAQGWHGCSSRQQQRQDRHGRHSQEYTAHSSSCKKQQISVTT